MDEVAQSGALAAGPVLARRSALPDAPIKETPKIGVSSLGAAALAPAEARPLSAHPVKGELEAPAKSQRLAVTPQVSKTPGVTTYRDQESGRLIIRVYDRERGDVLVEFPPENSLHAALPADGAAAAPPRHSVDA